jgi:RNA polymerase sigma-70 factor (ECF subfamily)
MSEQSTRIAALFEQHAPRLIVYARRQAGPADAEDLVSEAFVVAMRRLEDLPSESGETFAWLVGTVRRLAANHRRRRAVRDRYWRDAVREGWHATGSFEDAVADRERCLAALADLSTADRELLLLVAWEGLTAEQAASVLGISRNTLAVRMFRARQRLEDHLHEGPTPRAVTTKDQTHA